MMNLHSGIDTVSSQLYTDEPGVSTTAIESPKGPLLSFFIPDLSVGGAEQVTVNIVNGLAARGHNVELLLSRFEGELQQNLNSSVSVVTLQPENTSVFGVAAHLPALASYVRNRKPAALIPHLEHPSVVCLALNRLLDTETAIIPTHHSALGGSVAESPKDRIVGQLVPRLYPAADRIIAVSEGVADGIVEQTAVERADISVLHNPVEIETVRARASEPFDHEWLDDDALSVVLFVGRHEDQKDLETWLRAFEQVHDRDPDTRGILVGKGSRRTALEALADQLGIGDVVAMPGYVDNPYAYMAGADTFLLSSRYEGLPTVLIEALATGCSIVSTDCPNGPREILADGEYGRLVPVGDVTGIADAVLASLENPTPPETLRARADDFSPAAVLDEYERFIAEYITAN